MKTSHSQLYRIIALASCLSVLLMAITPGKSIQIPAFTTPALTYASPHDAPSQGASSAIQPVPPGSQPPSITTAPPPVLAPVVSQHESPSERAQYQYHALLSPSGPLYTNQPFLNRIAAPAGWQAFNNSNGAPIIAVIDTGFALDHDTLKNRWVVNSAEINSTTDNNGNGYLADWRGWDFVHNDNDPRAGTTNPSGAAATHGTITSGLATILNPNARIMPLQALDDNGVGYTDQVGAAVRYAADNGANVISLSLGSSTDDPYLHQQIDYAIAKGVVVVAAAGNDGCNCMSYPANYPEVLAVGASDSANNTASFSSYGVNLDVLAPGTAGDVCSTAYTASNAINAYTCNYAGTSLSTPIVSGLAALMLQQHPGANPGAIATLIAQSAAKLASMGGQYFTLRQGYGLIQSGGAVAGVTILPPFGQFLNKVSVSLSNFSLEAGGLMDSTCSGIPGAVCTLTLHGPTGQEVIIGQRTLDGHGGAEFVWNATTLGLTSGQWTLTATTTYAGQTKSSVTTLTISP